MLIYLIDSKTPLRPIFRGSVNSIAFVIQPVEQTEPQEYKLACFWRNRIVNFHPLMPRSALSDPYLFRDYLFANALDGMVSINRSPPYSNIVNKLFVEEFTNIQKRYIGKK